VWHEYGSDHYKRRETYEIVFDPLTFTTTTFRAGFMSVFTGALPSNAAYLSITSAGTIGGVDINAGTLTSTGTTYTLSTATWYRAKIVVNAAGTSATFSLYNMSGTSLWSQSAAGLRRWRLQRLHYRKQRHDCSEHGRYRLHGAVLYRRQPDSITETCCARRDLERCHLNLPIA